MKEAEFDLSLERFREFLNTESVIPILSRNLSFLLDENRVVDSVEVRDDLFCRTEDTRVIIGGAPYLLREDFDRRHWLAALRVLLAHEVQHDNSSDRAVLYALRRWSGNFLHDKQGLDWNIGETLGHKILNILEDARVNNIVCGRFAGYVPLSRFVSYARCEALLEEMDAQSELSAFLCALSCFALTGELPPLSEAEGGERAAIEVWRLRGFVDAAVLAKTAEQCASECRGLLEQCGEYLAELCRRQTMLPEFLKALSATLEDYSFSEAERREQRGNGTDSGARARREDKKGVEGESEDSDTDEPDTEKGDTGGDGGGDNSTREGDESGSLSGQDVLPHSGAGNNGREDRGSSQSDGRSSNHGATGKGQGMHNSAVAASELAQVEGPQLISEVLGAGFSSERGSALTRDEIDEMLRTAKADLEREAAHEKESKVEEGEKSPLSFRDLSALKGLYPYVSFRESFITPLNRRLPAEYSEQARRLHLKLDRILREQRVRTANQRKGALSQKALWKVEVGDGDVFQRKNPPSKCDSAFYLLIDRSGSMGTGYGNGSSKLFTALLTAAVIEEALKGIAYTKVVAFDGGNEDVEHVVIKDFMQKEIGSRCYDALEQIAAGNGNKDGYSIRVAAADLEKRSEKRRILVVLSDGLPSAYCDESAAVGDVRSAVQEARRRGIIVIPIIYGGCDSPESFESYRQMYEKGIISTTPGNVLSEFEKLLLRLITSA